MNLYRQITAEELEDEINKMYNNYLIRDETDQFKVRHAIKTQSRREAKQSIRKYFSDTIEAAFFYKKVKNLYFALEWVQSGIPVYTDLFREDD